MIRTTDKQVHAARVEVFLAEEEYHRAAADLSRCNADEVMALVASSDSHALGPVARIAGHEVVQGVLAVYGMLAARRKERAAARLERAKEVLTLLEIHP